MRRKEKILTYTKAACETFSHAALSFVFFGIPKREGQFQYNRTGADSEPKTDAQIVACIGVWFTHSQRFTS